MGLVRDTLSRAVSFVGTEIVPLRGELIKAGILRPDASAYDPKASLVDPWAYGSTNQGYKEKFSILDHQKCRQISYADPIVAAIVQTRLNQVASFSTPQVDKYRVGFKIKLRDPEEKPSPGSKKRAKEITQFLVHCGVPEDFEDTPEIKRRDSFETFLRKITRDSLTFDQINFEITPRKNGQPYSFQAVDAATIRIIQDKRETVEQGQGYVEVAPDVHEPTEFERFKAKHPRYAQVINGLILHAFDEWELAFGVRNPRTDLIAQGYGFSEIEMLVTTITSHMNAETYNRKFFSQGSSIKGILTFEGAVPPDQLEAFRRQWYQQVTGVQNAWKTPIMSLGQGNKLNWTSLHSTNREMEFGNWMDYCIKTICGVFQIDPMEIGFDIAKQGTGEGGGGGGLGTGNQADRLTASQDKGLRPLLRHIQSVINEYVVYRLDPNFEFEFVGLNSGNEKDDLDKSIQQLKSFKTIDEIRAEHDLKPLPTPEKIKSLGNLILDPSWLNFVSSQIQAAQAAAQGPVGPDGQPLPPGASGGPPDGSGGAQGGGDDQDQDQGQEPEPDYESMSVDELEGELKKLQGPGGGQDEESGNEPKLDTAKAPPKQPQKPKKGLKKSLTKELLL